MEEGAKIAAARLQPKVEAKEKECELITRVLEDNIAANLMKDDEIEDLRNRKRTWMIVSGIIGVGFISASVAAIAQAVQ